MKLRVSVAGTAEHGSLLATAIGMRLRKNAIDVRSVERREREFGL